MKIKSVLASLGACAIALSATAISASAAITNANSDDKYMYPVVAEEGNNLPDGCKLSDVYGIEAKLNKTASGDETCVGAFCYQSDSNNWAQEEFCQQGGDKDIVIGNDGTVKLLKSTSLFAEGDTWGKVFIAEWSWDGDKQIDFAVDKITLLDKDGNPLGAAAAETTAAADTTAAAAATTTKAANSGSNTNEPSSKTGDAGAALAIAGLVSAGAAAYLVRRKH